MLLAELLLLSLQSPVAAVVEGRDQCCPMEGHFMALKGNYWIDVICVRVDFMVCTLIWYIQGIM